MVGGGGNIFSRHFAWTECLCAKRHSQDGKPAEGGRGERLWRRAKS